METKERTEGRLRRLLEQPGTFLKWVLFAGVIGLAAGGVSTAFYYALNAVTALREANPWLLWLLPLWREWRGEKCCQISWSCMDAMGRPRKG